MEENKRSNFWRKTQIFYRKIVEKKPHIEFITAILSIPVLLTVIIININNLKGQKNDKIAMVTPPPVQEKIYVTVPNSGTKTDVKAISQAPCKQTIGPITIASPEENEVVTDNPVAVNIDYKQGNFCSVVWSYQINGGTWSDFDDKSIALYNPPTGNIKFELKVKSVVSSDGLNLTRNFIYKGANTISTTPTATPSAN